MADFIEKFGKFLFLDLAMLIVMKKCINDTYWKFDWYI